jgi:hypothetical protein
VLVSTAGFLLRPGFLVVLVPLDVRGFPLFLARLRHALSVVSGRARQLVALVLAVSPDRSNLTAGSVGSVKGGFSLDRFPFASIVDRRVRGGVPPHPPPSGERLFLIYRPLLRTCPPVVLVVLVLVVSCGLLFPVRFPGLPRMRRWARCGVVVAGATCGQIRG